MPEPPCGKAANSPFMTARAADWKTAPTCSNRFIHNRHETARPWIVGCEMSIVPEGNALSVERVLDLKIVSDVQLAPLADRVAFVLSDSFKTYDEPIQSRIWLVDLATG